MDGRRTLGEWIEAQRAQLFVGRARELAMFEEVLRGERPERVLYLEGPGGIGKTQLLRELARRARHEGFAIVWIDGQSETPTAAAMESALSRALHDAADVSGRRLLVVDGFEHLRGLEAWWREHALPKVTGAVCTVLAGRCRLSEEWLSDPGWQSLLRVIPIAPLSREETVDYLARRSLADRADEIFAETHGHPLAIALVSEIARQDPSAPLALRDQPELLRRLVSQFLRDAPTELHARALRASAVALHTTEPLLRQMLGLESARELYSWLSELTFMQAATTGLMPHEAVRMLLLEGLRWQAPELYRELLFAALRHYDALCASEAFWDRRSLRAAYFVLSQCHPPLHDSAMLGEFALRPAGDSDWPAIDAMIRRHEGTAAAELARTYREQPGEWTVVATPNDPCCGFVHLAALQALDPDLIARDPGAEAAWRHAEGAGALADGRPVWMIRFWMAAEEFQAACTTQSWIFQHLIERTVLTEEPAYVLHCIHDIDNWKRIQSPTSLNLVPDLSFEHDGRHYGMAARDFRRQTPREWYRSHFHFFLGMTDAAGAGEQADAPSRQRAARARLRNAKQFEMAVKAALRSIHRLEVLCQSPLTELRIVISRCGQESSLDRAEALAGLLRERAETFCTSEKGASLYRVLERAYLKPAVKQEAAATDLGMAYSTYRRHLARAIERLAELLRLEEQALADRELRPSPTDPRARE